MREQTFRWRMIGIGAGGLAMTLAATGAVLSIRHSQSLGERVLEQVAARCRQRADEINRSVEALSAASAGPERGSQTAMLGAEELLARGRLVIANDGDLFLKAQGEALSPWEAPLAGPLEGWVVAPREGFLLELNRATWAQASIFIGVTALAVAAMLYAVWFTARLARREIALSEMKAHFVADVSHELKTPLALIRLYAETLQSGRVTSEEKRQEYYSVIGRESERLTDLINNILDFSKIEAGRKEYDLRATDVAQVVRDTYEAYRPQLEHHGFEHRLTVADAIPAIDADPGAISQVLVNLITNVIKYSQEEKYLAIDVTGDVRRGRRGALISVHDRGIGIQAEDRARLTEGFYRASDARVRQQGGTGLGLALVKRIVEAHNGSLDIESRLVKGSSFRVFLPASEGESIQSQV